MDNEGLTDFTTVRIVPLDIKPDSSQNTLNPRSKGVLPMAILSSPSFDATSIDTATLLMGPGGAAVAHPGGHFEDVVDDDDVDLVLHFPIPNLGAGASATRPCKTGSLADDESFEACDQIRIVGKSK